MLFATIAWSQVSGGSTNSTVFSNSAAEVDTVNTTPVTQQVNTFQVELKARMQGGAYLFDKTYNVAYSDPTVQAAIAQAQGQLTSAGAVSFTGPTQLSSTQSQVSSTTNTVETSRQTTQTSNIVSTFVGPQTVFIGDRGVCQTDPTTTPTANLVNIQSGGPCSAGTAFTLAGGQMDIDVMILSRVTINKTATTTNTVLTTQVYELDGIPAATPPPTPAPPSLILALTGLAGAGLFAASQRLRRAG